MNGIQETMKEIINGDDFKSFLKEHQVPSNLKKEYENLLEAIFLINLDEKLNNLAMSLENSIPKKIQLEIIEFTPHFVIFARILQYLRKNRFLNTTEKLTPTLINDLKKDFLIKGGFNCNNTESLNLEYDLLSIKNSSPIKSLTHVLKKSKYFERDMFLIWLQDLFIKHNPEKYHHLFSFTLKQFETYFPELFPRKILHGHGYESDTKSNMNKIRKRYSNN